MLIHFLSKFPSEVLLYCMKQSPINCFPLTKPERKLFQLINILHCNGYLSSNNQLNYSSPFVSVYITPLVQFTCFYQFIVAHQQISRSNAFWLSSSNIGKYSILPSSTTKEKFNSSYCRTIFFHGKEILSYSAAPSTDFTGTILCLAVKDILGVYFPWLTSEEFLQLCRSEQIHRYKPDTTTTDSDSSLRLISVEQLDQYWHLFQSKILSSPSSDELIQCTKATTEVEQSDQHISSSEENPPQEGEKSLQLVIEEEEKCSIVHLTLCGEDDPDLEKVLTNIKEDNKEQNDLIIIGNCFLQMFEYDKAEDYFHQLLKGHSIDQSFDIADIYYGLAKVFQKKGKNRLAIEYLHKTLTHLSKDHSLLHQSYNDLGHIYRHQNQSLLSMEYFEKALHQEKNVHFVTFFGLSQVHYQLSNYFLALQYLQKAFDNSSQIITHSTAANLFLHMSKIYIVMNDQDKANELLEKVLALQLKHLPPNHPDLAYTYSTLGLMHSQIGVEQKGIRYLEQGLEIQHETLPEKHPDFGQSYQYLADLFRKKGNLEQALIYDQKFLENQLKTLSVNHPIIAQIHLNIGNIQWQLKDYEHASLSLKKVLHHHLENENLGHPLISESFRLLADLYFDQYNEHEDKTVLEEVLTFYRKYLHNELLTKTNLDFSLIHIYEMIAALHFNHRHLDQALIYYNRLLDCHLQRHPPHSKTIEQIYHSIGKVYLKKHHVDPTLTFYQKQQQEEKHHLSFLEQLKYWENVSFERRHLLQALDYFQTLSKTFPSEDPLLAQTHLILAHLHAEQNHPELALQSFQQALDIYRTIHPQDHNLIQKIERNISHLININNSFISSTN